MEFWQIIINFFNSSFFGALSTILTIGGAIALYLWEKSQSKQQIARLLLNEIRNAQAAIQVLKDHSADPEFPVVAVLPQNSWNKYSHLFAKDFDQDDMEQINNFFNVAQEIENVVQKGNKINRFLLQITQRSEAIQQSIMDILANSGDDGVAKTRFDDFIRRIDTGKYHYAPSGFQTYFNEFLKNYSPVLGTHVGMALKKIANLKI